ncbi:DNA polymerase Y family protein [Henriciella sp. AS95]|uniref:Y-family DNA polymerase n=1 Tax=Henriciella sp. AS95 TaxID=3135782 RepID=UPI0031820A69
MKRYLSLWFPDWPLTRLRRERLSRQTSSPSGAPAKPRRPFVLTETGPSGLRIAAANSLAEKAGVTAGLAFTDAKARIPNLTSEDIDRAADARALDRLAHWMIRFTPLVAIDGSDAVMLETTGCDHLHGGEEKMVKAIAALLGANGIPCQSGLASTPGAATVLSRAAPGTILPDGQEADGLADLPVSALRLSGEATLLLRRFGLTRIGQLYGIDRKALARRFQSKSAADKVLHRLDQALGLRHEPLDPLRPVPAKSARLPCPEPIATREAIEIALEQLTGELCADLTAFGQGARHFVLTAFRADGTNTAIDVTTAQPVRTPKHILRLFHEKIDRIDPGFGIDLLLLDAHRTGSMQVSAAALSGDLAASDTDEVALSALADRINAKLGAGTVSIHQPAESHIPEQSERREAFDGALAEAPQPNQKAGPRPLRLLARPERVTVMAEVPDGPPLRFIWRRVARSVVRADGPERINPEWWTHTAPPQGHSPKGVSRKWLSPKLDKRADFDLIAEFRRSLEASEESAPVTHLPRARDYYRVEDEAGRRYWLYRDGLYEDGRGGPPDWFVQGLFA